MSDDFRGENSRQRIHQISHTHSFQTHRSFSPCSMTDGVVNDVNEVLLMWPTCEMLQIYGRRQTSAATDRSPQTVM